MDAAYGIGFYFTDISPEKCRAWTVAYCWRSLNVFEKVECYLKFNIPNDIIQNCREHVFMISDWDERIVYLEGNPTPKCSLGQCFMCHMVSQVKQALGLK